MLFIKNNLIYKKIKINKEYINDNIINNNIIDKDKNKIYNVFSIDPPNCKDIDDL